MNDYDRIRAAASPDLPAATDIPTIPVAEALAESGLFAVLDVAFYSGSDWVRLVRGAETVFLARDAYLDLVEDSSKGYGDSAVAIMTSRPVGRVVPDQRFCPLPGCPQAQVWLSPADGTETCLVHRGTLLVARRP
ncbi:MAG: hypothetical protein JNM77_16630 [Pseudonocardia sp.]|nr:hypothetical protein [Pseudonocardia sp.]